MTAQENISYGPHTFGDPDLYLRIGDRGILKKDSHENVKNTLVSAFSDRDFIKGLSRAPGFDPDLFFPVHLDFINYGNNQMVYSARPKQGQSFAILINQPQQELGVVKAEFESLQRLFQIDPDFVIPTWAYFKEGAHELYASSYVKDARCIYHNDSPFSWGTFNPIPTYHFERFSSEMEHEVTSSMIALLVNYYDSKRNMGIAKTQLSGDDFILSQDFDLKDPSSVLPNMKLISARSFIKTSLETYLGLLEKEFLHATHYNNYDVKVEGKFKVNCKSGASLTKEEIETGIGLGLRMRRQRANKK